MTSEFKNMVGSFLLGVVITALYFSVPVENLKLIYVTGLVASSGLSLLAMYMGAKNIAKQNVDYNKHWRQSESSVKKEVKILPIIKKKIALMPTALLVLGSWVSSIFLVGLLAKHIQENKAK